MESSENNWGNISETICLLDVALFGISSQIPYFHKLTPYSYHISFLTIPPHLQLISFISTMPKCTLHSVLFLLVSLEKAKEAKIRPIRPNSNVIVRLWPLWPFRGKTIEMRRRRRRRRRENNRNEEVEEEIDR